MAFYEAGLIAKWRGSLLAGALAGQMLVRLTIDVAGHWADYGGDVVEAW